MNTAQVERVELDQLTCWRVRTVHAELLVAQQGAQILSYQPDGQPPLIWLSEQAAYERGQSVRGGVPVCWPWFGDLRCNPPAVQAAYQPGLAPSHGLVRGLDWQLLGIDEDGDAVTLRFVFDSRQHLLPGWPHAARLQLDIRLGEDLALNLETHNQGDEPLVISQALHSYFAVSDVRQVGVEGLDGCRYLDTLDDWREHRQDGALQFVGETDRIYLGTPARLSIVDPGGGAVEPLDRQGQAPVAVRRRGLAGHAVHRDGQRHGGRGAPGRRRTARPAAAPVQRGPGRLSHCQVGRVVGPDLAQRHLANSGQRHKKQY
jgi:glucose-6-phosphate 1-epimerase